MIISNLIHPAFVIGSEAKQSIGRTMDCRAACRRLATTSQFYSSGSN